MAGEKDECLRSPSARANRGVEELTGRKAGIIIQCTERTSNEAGMEDGLDGSMGRDTD